MNPPSGPDPPLSPPAEGSVSGGEDFSAGLASPRNSPLLILVIPARTPFPTPANPEGPTAAPSRRLRACDGFFVRRRLSPGASAAGALPG